MTISLEFAKKWEDFSAKLGISTVSSLLYQHVNDVIFERLVKESVTLPTSEPTMANHVDIPIMEEKIALIHTEQNAIHCVSGYVIRELKKDKMNSDMLPLLEKLIENKTEIDDSQQRITSVNKVDSPK